jgi:CheY-like chemotaxis protein
MRILFVEDSESQQSLFGDVVDDWNMRNAARAFVVIRAVTVEEAKVVLEEQRIDAAIFDLRLPGGTGARVSPTKGNELAHLSLARVGIPIGIVSGFPGDLDADLKELDMLQSFDKGDTDVYEKVVAWLDSQWLMMTVLRSTREQIERSGADIFTKRLWPRWQTYAGLTGDSQTKLIQIVTRQYVGHVAELLGLDSGDNVSWHPYECYIRPALLASRAHTGDIFLLDETLWIVLTPQCDMATKKVANALLARIDETALPMWDERVQQLGIEDLSTTKRESRDRFFYRLVNQNVDVSEHFLPPLEGGAPLMVQFKEVITCRLTELNDNLDNRRASIAPAFLPNLIQRFGSYISRTGQPNIDIAHFV